MAGEYTVKILSSEEFNKLPFKRIQNNPDAIHGAADKKNRIAYVKDTGFNDLTKANIGHELDELMANVSPHEEDGIRYKDYSQMFSSFGSSIPAIGKVAGPVLGAVGQVPDLLGTGISSLGRGIKNVLTPGPAAKTTIPGYQGIGASKVVPSSGTSPVKSMFSGLGSAMSTPPAPKLTIPKFTPISSTPQVAPKTDFFSGAMDQLKSAAPGAAVSMLGNLFAPKVSAPDYSGVKADMEKRIGEGGSPAYDLGFGEAKRIIEQPFGEVPAAVFDPIDQRLADNITELENQFRSNQQSGAVSISDTTRFGRLKNDLIDQAEKEKAQLAFAYQQQQEVAKRETMTELLRLDQYQYDQYAQLANLDIATLVDQYGVDIQTATDFKTLFGNIGGQMINKAFA